MAEQCESDEESELFTAFLKSVKQYRNARGKRVQTKLTAVVSAYSACISYKTYKAVIGISDRYSAAGLYLPCDTCGEETYRCRCGDIAEQEEEPTNAEEIHTA